MSAEEKNALSIAESRISEVHNQGGKGLYFFDLPELREIPATIHWAIGVDWVDISNTKISDVSKLSELHALKVLRMENTPIAEMIIFGGLTEIEVLSLSGTPFSNCAQLVQLKNLRTLYLNRSQVSDLRPLLWLDDFWRNTTSAFDIKPEIRFEETPAVEFDETLASLSEIDDDTVRKKETWRHLKSLPPWPEPLPWEAGKAPKPRAPTQKTHLDLVWTADGFALHSNPVSIDDDPVATATRDDLLQMMNELCRQSGNHHENIYRRAEALRQRLGSAEIDRLPIHLAFQRLQRLYDNRANRDDPLQSDVEATLQDVVETLPGLTLSDPKVRKLLERQAQNRADRVETAQVEAEIGVLNAASADDTPLDYEAKELAKDAATPNIDDQLTRTRPSLSWNVVVAIGQEFKNAPVATGTLVLTTLSPQIAASAPWLAAHAAEITAAAQVWGPEFLGWINPIIDQARTIHDAMKSRKP